MPRSIFARIDYQKRYEVDFEEDKIVSITYFDYPTGVEHTRKGDKVQLDDVTFEIGAPWSHLSSQEDTGPAAELLTKMRNSNVAP